MPLNNILTNYYLLAVMHALFSPQCHHVPSTARRAIVVRHEVSLQADLMSDLLLRTKVGGKGGEGRRVLLFYN